MKMRHELKYMINYQDVLCLRQRLSTLLTPDTHAAADGRYKIRSLYFDMLSDRALREKIDGSDRREKFRIRCYNDNYGFIRLEKKIKVNGLCGKFSVSLQRDQVDLILRGRIDWMPSAGPPLLSEFYSKLRGGLVPKVIVDYTREPFIYPPGNVRITLDSALRTGLRCTDFLDPDCPTIPVADDPTILEVKFDEYLPAVVRAAVQLHSRSAGAFSKYAVCRMFE